MTTTGIDSTLEERGSRYGEFPEHARITQNIKQSMVDSPRWGSLPCDMKECLEMVAHKIGRILNGDPFYHDSWHDIEGYVHLVAQKILDNEAAAKNSANSRDPFIDPERAKKALEAIAHLRTRNDVEAQWPWPDEDPDAGESTPKVAPTEKARSALIILSGEESRRLSSALFEDAGIRVLGSGKERLALKTKVYGKRLREGIRPCASGEAKSAVSDTIAKLKRINSQNPDAQALDAMRQAEAEAEEERHL